MEGEEQQHNNCIHAKTLEQMTMKTWWRHRSGARRIRWRRRKMHNMRRKRPQRTVKHNRPQRVMSTMQVVLVSQVRVRLSITYIHWRTTGQDNIEKGERQALGENRGMYEHQHPPLVMLTWLVGCDNTKRLSITGTVDIETGTEAGEILGMYMQWSRESCHSDWQDVISLINTVTEDGAGCKSSQHDSRDVMPLTDDPTGLQSGDPVVQPWGHDSS